MFMNRMLRSYLTTTTSDDDTDAATTAEDETSTSTPSAPTIPYVSLVGPALGSQENKWRGGVLSPHDSSIYFIPCWATHVLRFSPSTLTATAIGDHTGGGMYKWSGGVCVGGFIYGIPCNARRILKIDPRGEGRTSLVGGDLGDGHMKWISGVLAEDDGCIYCMPYDARRILRFDPRTEETELVGEDLGDGYKYSDTVLLRREAFGSSADPPSSSTAGASCCIVGIPFNARRVLVYSPSTRTTTHIGNDMGAAYAKWCGGVCAPDGNVYGVPNFSDFVLRIDVREGDGEDHGPSETGDHQELGEEGPVGRAQAMTGTSRTVGKRQFGCKGKWYGGTAGEDGRLYFTPSCSTHVLRLDPSDLSTVKLEPELGRDYYKWSGSVLANDGRIYCVPSSSTRILRVDTRTSIEGIHRVVRMGLWGSVRRLLRDESIPREDRVRALSSGETHNDGGDGNGDRNVLCAALGYGAPTDLVVEIVKGNYTVLGQSDSVSGLYPFMLAAVGDGASLGSVYEILKCHPALIHEFV